MTKFKKGDKVKLAHPNNIDNYIDYDDEWKEFWYDNKNIIFIIHSVTHNYQLQYINGDDVVNPDDFYIIAEFRYDELELELYTNPLPDELFEI